MVGDRGQNRWLEGGAPRGDSYDHRFEKLAADGFDVHGEADLVTSLKPGSVLDAGCGTGRVAMELNRRGTEVVGVDIDGAMLEAARRKAPGLSWVQADLSRVDLGRRFDLVVMAGNVMIFLSPGSEGPVLTNMARHLVSGGLLVAGFSLGAGLELAELDRLAARPNLRLVERWATWDKQPFEAGGPYAVTVYERGPEGSVSEAGGPVGTSESPA